MGTLSGRHLVKHHNCSYSPSVEASDVLAVNFDRKTIGPDGLYLIAYPATGPGSFNCAWGGVRRFCSEPTGLKIYEGDKWRPLKKGHGAMVVIGHVETVYRPVQ